MNTTRRRRVVPAALVALGIVLLAPMLRSIFGALFSVYVGPGLETGGGRIPIDQVHAIATGLTILSGATAVLVAWLVFSRMTRGRS